MATTTTSKSYRLPNSLLERLDQIAKATESTQTEVLVALLHRGLKAVDEGEDVLHLPSIVARQDTPSEDWETRLMPRLRELVDEAVQDALQEKAKDLGEWAA